MNNRIVHRPTAGRYIYRWIRACMRVFFFATVGRWIYTYYSTYYFLGYWYFAYTDDLYVRSVRATHAQYIVVGWMGRCFGYVRTYVQAGRQAEKLARTALCVHSWHDTARLASERGVWREFVVKGRPSMGGHSVRARVCGKRRAWERERD